jgi:hypothetical protein
MARHQTWASCEFSIIKEGSPAVIHTHIRAVSFSDAIERALVYGAGRDPLGVTDGYYAPGDMSLEFLSKWFRTWARDVTNGGELMLGDLDFRLVLKRQARGDAEAHTDRVDFVINGAEDSGNQGSGDPLVTVCPCQPIDIWRNGVHL